MKRLGKLAAGFPSTLCVHVPYLLYVYQTITSAFGKLKSNGVRVRGKSRTKQSHQWQPSVLYANSPLFWFGRGDQPALSAQTRTHEMYTQNCLLQYYKTSGARALPDHQTDVGTADRETFQKNTR